MAKECDCWTTPKQLDAANEGASLRFEFTHPLRMIKVAVVDKGQVFEYLVLDELARPFGDLIRLPLIVRFVPEIDRLGR